MLRVHGQLRYDNSSTTSPMRCARYGLSDGGVLMRLVAAKKNEVVSRTEERKRHTAEG